MATEYVMDPMSLRAKRSNLPLEQVLEKYLQKKVLLTLTDNASIFLNAKLVKGVWHLRLHKMFLRAKPELWRDIAHFSETHNKAASGNIDRYIEDHWHEVKHRMPPIVTKGKVYDLEKIFNALNRRYLQNQVTAKITWGEKATRRAYEQMQMGSYSTSKNLITVHPHLDQKFVPEYVVEATIFHEMCHAVLPAKKINGRRQIHPPAFKKLEERYVHLKKAQEWEGKNLRLLLKKPRNK